MLEPILTHWPLKLLALALAFGIWITVTGESAVIQDFHPPLTIALPADRALAADSPNVVTVRLRGPESLLRRLDPLRMTVNVDLSDGAIGERDISLNRGDLTGVPRGLEVDFMDPDRLRLVVDRKVQKPLDVDPTFLGRPPEGYAFYGAEIRPRRLTVEGPESQVEALTVLRTDPIRLDRLTRPTDTVVGTIPDQRHVRVITTEPLQVRVIVDATPVERKFQAVQVVVSGSAYVTTVSPATISVTLAGPPALLESMALDQLQAVADATGLEPRTRSYSVDLVLRYRDASVQENPRLSIESLSGSTARVVVTERKVAP